VGIVLAGGKSRRMGRDKAVIDFDGMTLLRRAVVAFEDAGVSPILVVGRTELPEDLRRVRAIDDRQPGSGPLGGIVSGLLSILEADADAGQAGETAPGLAPGALVLACDLPFIDAPAVATLLERAHASPHAPGVLGHDGERPQPLFALIRPASFPAIIDAFNNGVFSPMGIFTELGFTAAPVIDDGRLGDVDTPEELAGAQRRLPATPDPTFTELDTESG